MLMRIVPGFVMLLSAAACGAADTPEMGGAAVSVADRPVQATLDSFRVTLGFADGRHCRVEALAGDRAVPNGDWSRYEIDCAGIESLHVEFLPPLPPSPPDPNYPEPPPLVADYTGSLDIIRLPASDLEGASVTVFGSGGVGVFTRWPGHDG